MQQGKVFVTVCINMTLKISLLRSCLVENDQLFFVAEIEYNIHVVSVNVVVAE